MYINYNNVLPTYTNWRLTNIEGGIDTSFNKNTYLSFADSLKAGDGKLYELAPVILYGGKLVADETLLNSATLYGDLIVNPGATLTINNSLTSYGDISLKNGAKLRTTNSEIGGTLTFLQGKKLIIEDEVEINGLPNMKLTLNFTAPVEENGITVYNEDKLTIKNTLIKNAYEGIFVNKGELYIDSSEITDCSTGLYLNKTSYQPDMHEGTKVWNTNIHDNSSGITLLEGSAILVGNEISDNSTYGISCLENASPMFGELLEPGLNYMNNNEINLYSSVSFPIVGIEDREYIGGYNSFEGSDVNFQVVAIEKSYFLAEQNWWGQEEPNPKKFRVDESSEIDYIPYLTTPPFGNKNTSIKYANANSTPILELISPNEILRRAVKYLYNGDKNSCRLLLKNILQNYQDSAAAFAALDLLSKTYVNSLRKDSLKSYLQQFTAQSQQNDIIVFAKLLLADFDQVNYSINLNSIISSYSNSNLKDLIYFKKFKHYLFDKNSKDSARIVSNQMVTLFPESPLTRETKFLLEKICCQSAT